MDEERSLMKKINWVIILLSVIIMLLLLDILTGIWYLNRVDLKFSSVEFNNIITPISGIIAIIIYSVALTTSQKQNKIINSFQHKDLFIKDIQKLRKEGKEIEVKLVGIYTTNFIEFESTITNIFIEELFKNDEYEIDTNTYNDISKEEIEKKSYYPQMIFINQIVLKHSLNHGYYIKLQKLINKVLDSDLIDSHKKEIFEEIENELIRDYLELINTIKTISKYSRKSIPFAITTLDIKQMNYKWMSILSTELSEFYNWYHEKIK